MAFIVDNEVPTFLSSGGPIMVTFGRGRILYAKVLVTFFATGRGRFSCRRCVAKQRIKVSSQCFIFCSNLCFIFVQGQSCFVYKLFWPCVVLVIPVYCFVCL